VAGGKLEFMAPGKLIQTAFVERFNRIYGEQGLILLVSSLDQVRGFTESGLRLREYYAARPPQISGNLPSVEHFGVNFKLKTVMLARL